MKTNKWIIPFLALLEWNGCYSNPDKPKQFYQNFNFVTLKPIGMANDTLTQIPYVKIDTLQNQFLRVCLVTTYQKDTFIYEKYEKGWLIRDTCCESTGYQFDMHDGSKKISYYYRGNPYQIGSFNLATVSLTQADYTEDLYVFGFYNDNQALPNFDFKVDTSKYIWKLKTQYLHQKDTFCKISNNFGSSAFLAIFELGCKR